VRKGKEDIVRFTLRLVPALNEKLDKIAENRGQTKHALILEVLWAHVEQKRARGA
jgi:predicted transcriptional regulator